MPEGTLTVTVECVSRVLRAGQCTLINPGVIHATKCTAPNTAILFQIPLDFISLYIPDVHKLIFVLDDQAASPIRRTKIDIYKPESEDERLKPSQRRARLYGAAL